MRAGRSPVGEVNRGGSHVKADATDVTTIGRRAAEPNCEGPSHPRRTQTGFRARVSTAYTVRGAASLELRAPGGARTRKAEVRGERAAPKACDRRVPAPAFGHRRRTPASHRRHHGARRDLLAG